jgi:hypothetical protein
MTVMPVVKSISICAQPVYCVIHDRNILTQINGEIRKDNANRPPFIRQQLWQSECGHLAKSSTEALYSHAGDDLRI